MKQVTSSKPVPVNNIETLKEWLDTEMVEFLKPKRDGGESVRHAGSKVVDLIIEAGFQISPPVHKSQDYEDTWDCPKCGRETVHMCHDSGHERDSSHDWRECSVCGNIVTGMDVPT